MPLRILLLQRSSIVLIVTTFFLPRRRPSTLRLQTFSAYAYNTLKKSAFAKSVGGGGGGDGGGGGGDDDGGQRTNTRARRSCVASVAADVSRVVANERWPDGSGGGDGGGSGERGATQCEEQATGAKNILNNDRGERPRAWRVRARVHSRFVDCHFALATSLRVASFCAVLRRL